MDKHSPYTERPSFYVISFPSQSEMLFCLGHQLFLRAVSSSFVLTSPSQRCCVQKDHPFTQADLLLTQVHSATCFPISGYFFKGPIVSPASLISLMKSILSQRFILIKTEVMDMIHQILKNHVIFFFKDECDLIYLFIYLYLFLTVLGLRFCARAFSSCGERGPLFIEVRKPLTIAASLVAEHRLQTCGEQLWLTGLVALRHVGSSQTRAQTRVPCIGRQILNHCATREAQPRKFKIMARHMF